LIKRERRKQRKKEMKYIIKAQVKPYTRTRKGKMERVGGYSREQIKREKSRECLTHLSLNTLQNLLGDKDPDTKEFQVDVRAEIAKRRVGEPYSVKEHTQDEYKKYLASLNQDEKELSLEQWKLRLAIEEPELGEPYEVEKPLRHIELETKGMKKTKEWKIKEALRVNSNTEKPPKVLDASFKRDINKELHDISTTYHTEFPSDAIFDILKKRGIVVLSEEGTEWSGFFLGASAQTFFPIAPIGSAEVRASNRTKENTYTVYTPFKNTALAMSWYKMPSGKYEMTTYVG
jgi:hypothetical protein